MKTNLHLRSVAVILAFAALVASASAQPAPAVNPATSLPAPGGPPIINPTTGLPEAQPAPPEPQWIDTNWPDPDIVLTNVVYDGLPVVEVARHLRERFQDYFDILPMPRTFDRDWGTEINIQLQLKNVRASDVFNAMNLVFENDRTPVRWELKMNHNRPIAQLRVLPEAETSSASEPPSPPMVRRVYFIGDMVADGNSGGMTMDQIFQTLIEVWQSAYGMTDNAIRLHEQAQLVVVTGTAEQVDFIKQTLEALHEKANFERGAVAAKTESPKSAGPK